MGNTKISNAIMDTAIKRGLDKTTCPSEIARMLFPDDWREHMTEIVDVAIELHNEGKVMITQKGEPIDVGHIRGPIRIRII